MPQTPALLITRPEPQASRLADALRAEWGDGLKICLSPLMQTEFRRPTLPDRPFATLLLTSEAGAMAAGRLLDAGVALPPDCACVGQRAAAAVTAIGLRVTAQAPTASALLAALLARPAGPYLYLHGRDVTLPLQEMLAQAGHIAHAAEVYAQREMPLTPDALALMRARPVLVPLYSARSARLFAQAVAVDSWENLRPVAVSQAVVLALPAGLAERAVVADAPDGAAMQAAIRRAILGQSP